jgi:hypothetical protein
VCAAEHTAESGRKDTSSAASFYVLGAADDVYDLENKKWTERMRITILLAMSIYKGERARSSAAVSLVNGWQKSLLESWLCGWELSAPYRQALRVRCSSMMCIQTKGIYVILCVS